MGTRNSMLVAIGVLWIYSVSAETPYSLVNSSDSSYTDAWKTAGNLCQFCCLTDKVLWTMDTTICNPVTDRDLWMLFYALYAIAAVVVAFPLCWAGVYICATYQITICRIQNRTIWELLKRWIWRPFIDFDRRRKNGSWFNRLGKKDKAINYGKLG